MHTTDATQIFQRYWRHLTDDQTHDLIAASAARLALRLAIEDAGLAAVEHLTNVTPAPAGHTSNMPDPRIAEWQQAQIASLNEWLEHNRLDLYFDGKLDTAQAILAALASLEDRLVTALEDRRVAEEANRRLRDWLHTNIEDAGALDDTELVIHTITGLRSQLAQMDADETNLRQTINDLQREIDRLTRQNTIALDTLNSHLAERTNGAAPVDVTEPPMPATTGAWWANLDDETNDWRISVEAGRRTFRQLSRPTRLLLAQAVARHIGGGNLPKQSKFDAHKPTWMPVATSLVVTFGCTWSELLSVAPADVAP